MKIRIGPFEINDLKVVQQSGQEAWVAFPSAKSRDGVWYPIVRVTDIGLKEAIAEAVLTIRSPPVKKAATKDEVWGERVARERAESADDAIPF